LVEQRTENPRVGGSIPSLAIAPPIVDVGLARQRTTASRGRRSYWYWMYSGLGLSANTSAGVINRLPRFFVSLR
jgi:hypothetical protein